ncbi:MAG: response regulator [Oscillatoriales cyanobacterium]|nr:MAG: response regulator [Oscillatoriales cyanobacterium]
MITKKVLVIDDEADMREIARIGLEVCNGWRVLLAASGAEGIKVATNEQPDAILLDMMMPQMDGTATLEVLQGDAATSHIPVILLTAKVQAADRQRYAHLNATAVVTKPFDPLMLGDSISQILGW